MTASQVRGEALLKPGELGLLPREETGHGIHEDVLLREMTGDGFVVVARHEGWPGDGERYCVVFRRTGG